MKKIEDIDKIISEMTLDEKARLVNGATFFGSFGIKRLDVPRMQLLDGGTGINYEQLFGDMTECFEDNDVADTSMLGSTALSHVIEYFYEPERLNEEEKLLFGRIKAMLNERLKGIKYSPACFPAGILLGSTWNPDVVRNVGEALGVEACLYGVHVLLGSPNINIHRDPLNGRLFEGYSEDPCLVSRLAPELVKGVQSYGAAANVKHFAANNQETNRVGINERISRRALEEIYFPGFHACVRDGGVKTVMSAYNCINGVPCTENDWLLTDKLRGEWGFDGAVVSDWGAVYRPARAVMAGNDLAMPGPREWSEISDAVRNGELSEQTLDVSVRRILELVKWLGENYRDDIVDEYDVDELVKITDRAAYDAACEGIVMLKNDGLMPLKNDSRVCIVGSGAYGIAECGTGSAGINTDRTGDLYSYLAKYLGEGNVTVEIDSEADNQVAVVVCSLAGMEGNDRKDLKLRSEDIELISRIDIPMVLVLNTCGPVELDCISNKNNVHAIFETFLPGMEGCHALADILMGRVNPSGKLPVTFPVRYEDSPTFINFPGDGYEVNYGEGIFVGYRYYDKKKIKPLYPFGYGLSYTEFKCELINVKLSGNDIHIEVDIANIGSVYGGEVVQIYVGDPYSTLTKPVRELKQFKKIFLNAGEHKRIEFELPVDALASYDSDLDMWTVEEGYYDIYASVSSGEDDIFGCGRVYVDVKSPYSYSVNSTVKTICETQKLKECAYSLWRKYGWDTGTLDDNYQYTSGRTLSEIVDGIKSIADTDRDAERIKSEFVCEFNAAASKIIKL